MDGDAPATTGDGRTAIGDENAATGDGSADRGYRSAEGQYCSRVPENPFYECLRGQGLVCATTYSSPILDADGGVGSQAVYLCRQACRQGSACYQRGDVCCPATLADQSSGTDGGDVCAPADRCDRAAAGAQD